MELTLDGDVVRAGYEARERFYDSRGYGKVRNGDIDLAPVEAAHLLYRGDIESIDGMDFRAFLGSAAVSEVDFAVYKDLRDRGFYLTPAREGWVDDAAGADFVVYPRGKGPWDNEVAYRVRIVGERDTVVATDLGDCVLAVVDEESEVTYLDIDRRDVSGTSDAAVPATAGELLGERVVCWEPPAELYDQAFYGQQLGDEGAVQLSLVEAAYLTQEGLLTVDGGADAVVERGREVEGDRFDRRLTVYAALRASGVAPKTGFKFGADFRTYADVESAENLGHSELLVRVLPHDHRFEPRDLALDVRLAHGVRKTMVFALTTDGGDGDIEWIAVERLTP
ncbi:tRNA-intron lyase [Haloarcula japonica]|uniref:tRNA-splicing endonuclease n=1 Tax=Haloarcula japonica (strain ATCC 49778 / DSM 6131 / JCM 7785 / NBRC 101032 / NCIMB 13157 / TR-1) TaxID=1227453 RepID=M0LS81_HALJT|nr:tRNA-intron lyase [Haloarcula japonica]EMA34925.1 tRNA splicing endonuclease [Haloarcula japonica DSM 6131]